jgi:mannose/fructose/N-acetylgalactosamine-specific phosphotransferase system component IIB
MANTRFNIGRQLPKAPNNEIHVMVSNPNDPVEANQYHQVTLKSLLDPITDEAKKAIKHVTDPSKILSQTEINEDSVTMIVDRPEAGVTAIKRMVDINGKFNIGAATTVAETSATQITIVVTGFADESSAGDALGLTLFWKTPAATTTPPVVGPVGTTPN